MQVGTVRQEKGRAIMHFSTLSEWHRIEMSTGDAIADHDTIRGNRVWSQMIKHAPMVEYACRIRSKLNASALRGEIF